MPPAEELYAENRSLKEENAELRAQIEWFKRKVFGRGQSEKLPAPPEQRSRAWRCRPDGKNGTPPLQLVTYERRQPSGEKRLLPAETFAKLPCTRPS